MRERERERKKDRFIICMIWLARPIGACHSNCRCELTIGMKRLFSFLFISSPLFYCACLFLPFPFLYELDSSLKQASPSALIQRLYSADLSCKHPGSWGIDDTEILIHYRAVHRAISLGFFPQASCECGQASKVCVWEGWCAGKSGSKNKHCIEVQAQRKILLSKYDMCMHFCVVYAFLTLKVGLKCLKDSYI